MVVSNIRAASGRIYTAEADLSVGHFAYNDRHSHYDGIPATLQGHTYIRTRNNDSAASGVADFLTFQVDRAATVYVAYNGTLPPAWMRSGGFTNTGETLTVVRDTDGRQLRFELWAKEFGAGTVTLGSNRDAGSNGSSMYTVSVLPSLSPPLPPGAPDFNTVIRGIRPRGFGQGTYTLLQPAAGRTMYWVATTGDDAWPGTAAQPFRTIHRAAQIAQAGDVVTIRSGSYDETVIVRHGGTVEARLVFQAERRGEVVLGGSNDKVFQPRHWVGETGRTGPAWVTLRGLIFRDYGVQDLAAGNAVRVGRGWRIEDCLFDRSAYSGLNVVDHDVEIIGTTFQFHEMHAFRIGTKDLGARNASDPLYLPLTGIRIIDVVLRGNHTTSNTLEGAVGTRVMKIMMSRGLLIDNMESTENNGQGVWLDNKNSHYTVRNSYFHGNRGYTTSAGVYRPEAGRGLYIEKNWGGGLVENNVIMNNEGSGIQLANNLTLIVRNNLFVRNDRSLLLTNMSDSHPSYDIFPFRNLLIEGNWFKDWGRSASIHYPGGPSETPASLNFVANRNHYHPGRVTTLAWWPSPVGGASSIATLQQQYGWEQNGRIGVIPW